MDNFIKEFIKENILCSTPDLMLKYKNLDKCDLIFAANQIKVRQKVKNKLPSFYSNFDLIFPEVIQIEQTSSESTANYKSHITNYFIVADLTGGWGIDSYFFSKRASKIYHIEKSQDLSKIAKQNFKALQIDNVEFLSMDCIEFLKNNNTIDFLYIDPARRNEKGNKMYHISDLSPDLNAVFQVIPDSVNKILVKLSPMTDITLVLNELSKVNPIFQAKSIHIVSVQNECKELLILFEKKIIEDAIYIAVNLLSNNENAYTFSKNENNNIENILYSDVMNYLYEPNSSLMKMGFWKAYSKKWNLNQISANTHLFTSNEIIEKFPGRVFKIKKELAVNKKEISKFCPNMKANVAVRNYPISAEMLKHKLGLSDGGDCYIWAFKNNNNDSQLFLTEKIY